MKRSTLFFVVCISTALMGCASSIPEPEPVALQQFLTCGASDSLEIVRTARVKSGRRQINVGWKIYDILVTDGYRLLYAFKEPAYPFAKVKIERGGARYPEEKSLIIQQHRALKDVRTDSLNLNGMELLSSEPDSVVPNKTAGMYTAFSDANRLVVTIHLVNPVRWNFLRERDLAARRFHDKASFLPLRDDFLHTLTSCINGRMGEVSRDST